MYTQHGSQKQVLKQQGFTLIELMIVVAIIGILAAIAIPAYQNYVAKAQMSEALTLASGFETNVADYWMENGSVSGVDNTDLGIDADSSGGKYVKSVSVDQDQITATMKGSGVAAGIKDKKLYLTAYAKKDGDTTKTQLSDADNAADAGSIVWECTSNVEQKYLPSSCESTASGSEG
jgi:type IV pilus assembly protein PilA